jgi:hypothetical protein
MPISVEYLVVAGGGGGGSDTGGGGGGGGVLTGTASKAYATTFTVTVGDGGAGGHLRVGGPLSPRQCSARTALDAERGAVPPLGKSGSSIRGRYRFSNRHSECLIPHAQTRCKDQGLALPQAIACSPFF